MCDQKGFWEQNDHVPRLLPINVHIDLRHSYGVKCPHNNTFTVVLFYFTQQWDKISRFWFSVHLCSDPLYILYCESSEMMLYYTAHKSNILHIVDRLCCGRTFPGYKAGAAMPFGCLTLGEKKDYNNPSEVTDKYDLGQIVKSWVPSILSCYLVYKHSWRTWLK